MDLIQNSVLKFRKHAAHGYTGQALLNSTSWNYTSNFFTHVLHLPMLQLDVEI